jgi:CheY-like chemotaxis protein
MADLRSILIVDDDEDLRVLTSIAVGREPGWRVLTAASGAEAIAVARRERPDLILLDLSMPGLDGAATYAELRSEPETAAIPVVVVTASIQKHELERLAAMGCAGIIRKPFDALALPAELRRIAADRWR